MTAHVTQAATQSKAARQHGELRAMAETIARLRREKMELVRELRDAKDKLRRALLEAGKENLT
jgi:uncharacterized protein (UPF0335 family)